MTGINECIRERLSASHRAQQCPHWTPQKFMFMLIVAAVPYTSEKCLVFMVMLAFDFRANPPLRHWRWFPSSVKEIKEFNVNAS